MSKAIRTHECPDCGKEFDTDDGVARHRPLAHKMPYQHRQRFEEVYWDLSLTLEEVAEKLECSVPTVVKYRKKHNVEKRGQKGQLHGKEYVKKDVLERLYCDEKLSKQEIAEQYDIDPSTVLYHLRRHGIDTRSISEAHRVKRLELRTDRQGYERVASGDGTVGIHRLTAIANGEDPFEVFKPGMEVHHRNGHQWDNRPVNLELLTVSDHMSKEMKIRHGSESYEVV